MDEWLEEVRQSLPGTISADEYVARTTAGAGLLGFRRGETLPLVAACRDEFVVPFTELVDRAWGPHFAIGSLGGLVLAGTSGIAAAVGHAPDQGLRRFVLYCGRLVHRHRGARPGGQRLRGPRTVRDALAEGEFPAG